MSVRYGCGGRGRFREVVKDVESGLQGRVDIGEIGEYGNSHIREMEREQGVSRLKDIRSDREKGCHGNDSSGNLRESGLLLAGGPLVSPHLVDRKRCLLAEDGYVGEDEELIRRGKYLREGGHGFYSDKGTSHMVLSPSQPRAFGFKSETGEKLCVGNAEFGSFSREGNDPGFQSDYAPTLKASQYLPQSRTQSPFCMSTASGFMEGLLMNEEPIEGNPGSRRRVISAPYISRTYTESPLSTGYISEEGEYVQVRESAAAETIANSKYFPIDDRAKNYSDYVHSYMMPSYQSDTENLMPPQQMVCASPVSRHTFLSEEAAVQRTEGAKYYFSEKDGHGNHADGHHHVMPSQSELKTDTMPSVSHMSDPVAKSSYRLLPELQQCSRMRGPVELSHEQLTGLKHLYPNCADIGACNFRCRKEECCPRDKKCFYSVEDVRCWHNLSSHKHHSQLSSTFDDYEPEDRFLVHVMNSPDYREPKPRRCTLLRQYQSLREDDRIHPHHNVVPHRHNQDPGMLHHYSLPCKTKAHYYEDQKGEAYTIRQHKIDNDCDSYIMDGDLCVDSKHNNVPGNFHASSCCECDICNLHGNTEVLLRGIHRYDSSSMSRKPYIEHQEHILKQIGQGVNDEFEHICSGDVQCRTLLSRSAHVENKNFTGVANGAFDNKQDTGCQLPFKKLPVRMRLGKPNDSSVCDIKKRLGPSPQINNSQLSKKHKSSNPSRGILHVKEPLGDHSSGPSASKATSEFTELDEYSEKFKEQVNRAFLEFVKLIFESSAQQRKYKGLDKYECVECDICGSSRKYKDTRSLAQHAHSCPRMDLRARHLGLHKALCLLMGWNNNLAPNNSPTLYALPESEHSAMKEDLIIWPPVVFVHNISIGNKDLRKQKIITIRKLESILEGAGFGGNNHTVHIGQDQGVMVVRFNATLSGLQAAQESHKSYAKIKHGREELQQVINGGCSSPEESDKAVPKIEDILYGYLGIAEDLPKLDSHIKKWSVVKSLKELLATAS